MYETNDFFYSVITFLYTKCFVHSYTVDVVFTLSYWNDTRRTFTWNKHIDDIDNSLVKYFGIFHQIKNKVTSKLSRELYFVFIYSKIRYAIEVYGNCSSTIMYKIRILPIKLMKMLLKFNRRTPQNYLHKMLNICMVNDNYVCCLLNCVNDALCGRCRDVFNP